MILDTSYNLASQIHLFWVTHEGSLVKNLIIIIQYESLNTTSLPCKLENIL